MSTFTGEHCDLQLIDAFAAFVEDFSCDLDFIDQPTTSPVAESVSTEQIKQNPGNQKKNIKKRTKKSNTEKIGSKISTVRTDLVPTNGQSPASGHLRWRSFPSFDKSDATIYFASSFARLMNSGDEVGLSKLITSHCAKDLTVNLTKDGFFAPVSQYIDMLSISSALQPDSVMCMNSTKVVDNKIFAVLLQKYTDVAEMYRVSNCIVTDSKYKPLFVGERKFIFSRRFSLDKRDTSKRQLILDFLDRNVDLQIYNRIDVVLTLHEHTKKIIHYDYLTTSTSVCYNGVHYTL
jgi:hypothetical protein